MQEEIEFIYIGYCGGMNDGVSNDKVWTAFKAGGVYYAGWGARGKTIRFKKHTGLYGTGALYSVMDKKKSKYKEVDAFMLFSILPDFKEQVASKLTLDILTNSVMPAI